LTEAYSESVDLKLANGLLHQMRHQVLDFVVPHSEKNLKVIATENLGPALLSPTSMSTLGKHFLADFI